MHRIIKLAYSNLNNFKGQDFRVTSSELMFTPGGKAIDSYAEDGTILIVFLNTIIGQTKHIKFTSLI